MDGVRWTADCARRVAALAALTGVAACAPDLGEPPPRPSAAESRAAIDGFFGDAIAAGECQLPAARVRAFEDHQHMRVWIVVQPFRARLRYRSAVTVPSVEESRAAMRRPGWTIARGVRDGLDRTLLGSGVHPAGSEAWVAGEMLLERVDATWRARAVDQHLDLPMGFER